MNKFLHNYSLDLIEKQIIHDVLYNPDLWRKAYKLLEADDFIFYRRQFEALLEIYKEKGDISPPYLIDRMENVHIFVASQIELPHPTGAFFSGFMEVLRERRIERDTRKLVADNERGLITGKQMQEGIEKLKKKSFTAHEIKSISSAIDDYYYEYCERKDNQEKGKSLLLQTDFKEFDRKIGLTRGELVTLAARTGIGKSAFTLNLALQVAVRGYSVLFVSLEMSNSQLFERIFAYETGVECEEFKFSRYDTGKFGGVAEAVNKKYKNLRLLHIPQATSVVVSSLARKLENVDMIVVDYLQILKDPFRQGETNSMRIGEMTGRLHALAQELNCVVISVSQVNREASRGLNKEPEIHQLRDSGSIEQDSDKVLFLNRDKEEKSPHATLYVAKNRSGQEYERINFKVDLSVMKFKEII